MGGVSSLVMLPKRQTEPSMNMIPVSSDTCTTGWQSAPVTSTVSLPTPAGLLLAKALLGHSFELGQQSHAWPTVSCKEHIIDNACLLACSTRC